MCLGAHISMAGSAPQRTKAYHTVAWRTVPCQASVVPRSDSQRLRRPSVHLISMKYGTARPTSPLFSQIEGTTDLHDQKIDQGFVQKLWFDCTSCTASTSWPYKIFESSAGVWQVRSLGSWTLLVKRKLDLQEITRSTALQVPFVFLCASTDSINNLC